MAVLAGRYDLLQRLGIGGFGEVHAAHDRVTGTPVAIKTLLPHIAEDAAARNRFLAEARVLAMLRHPGIVTLLDAGESEGQPYIVMELVEGQSLDAVIARHPGGMPVPEALRIIAALASALDYLHAAGIVHRDLKPSNVVLAGSGRVVLMDFGIARLMDVTQVTRTGAFLGTSEYVSPEQVQGRSVGPAADIYALGALAFHLLTGRPPFTGELAAVLYAHVHQPPPDARALRPDLPEHIADAINAALAKRDTERPPTAAAFVELLRDGSRPVRPRGQRAAPAPPAAASASPRRRKTALIVGGVLAAVAALALMVWLLRSGGPAGNAQRARDTATTGAAPAVAMATTPTAPAATPTSAPVVTVTAAATAPPQTPTAQATLAPPPTATALGRGENPGCCQVIVEQALHYPDGSKLLRLRFNMYPGSQWTSDRRPEEMASIAILDDQGRRDALQAVEGHAASDSQAREVTGEYWFTASNYGSSNMTLRYDQTTIPFVMEKAAGGPAATGISVEVDRGPGAVYYVGDNQTICIRYTVAPGASELPSNLHVRATNTVNGQEIQVLYEGRLTETLADGVRYCWSGPVQPPAGQEVITVQALCCGGLGSPNPAQVIQSASVTYTSRQR